LMLYCPEDQQEAVTEALTELGLQRRLFMLESEGVQVMQVVPWARPDVPHHIPLVMEGVRVGAG